MVREQGDVTGVNIINPQAPGGLGAMCSWSSSINSSFRPLGVILAPVKQLRKCASDTIIWVLQRGAKAEGLGEGSVQGRPVGSRGKACGVHSVTTASRTQRWASPGKGKLEPCWDHLSHILNSHET